MEADKPPLAGNTIRAAANDEPCIIARSSPSINQRDERKHSPVLTADYIKLSDDGQRQPFYADSYFI